VVDAVRHRHRLGKAAGTRAAELMAAPVLTVPLGASVADAVRLMVRLDVKHLPVMDARGRLAGIVTRSELLKVFLRPDPAIRWEVDHDVVRGKLGIAAGEIQVEVRDGWSACVVRWRATVRLRRWSGACRPWMVWSRSTPGSPGASTTR
jgi:CBS domain-containing protein